MTQHKIVDDIFDLKPGEVFSVPTYPIRIRRSISKFKEMGTPMIARLEKDTQRDGYFFKGKNSNGKGKVLFIPANIKAGDTLIIEWVDPTCARAIRFKPM